jgi:hypothetical protein
LVKGYKSNAVSDEGAKYETCLNLSTYGTIEKRATLQWNANHFEIMNSVTLYLKLESYM